VEIKKSKENKNSDNYRFKITMAQVNNNDISFTIDGFEEDIKVKTLPVDMHLWNIGFCYEKILENLKLKEYQNWKIENTKLTETYEKLICKILKIVESS
jgi:hypothetical protein